MDNTRKGAMLALLFRSACAVSGEPVWLATDPPWPCSYGSSVHQYGASFEEAFDNLFNFKIERCFIGCAETPYPPPAADCRYRYSFARLLASDECAMPGTCFRYRYFDTQNPQAGWRRSDSYFRMSFKAGQSCPDGNTVATDPDGQLACVEPPAQPWDDDKNLGMACAGHTLAGNPVNIATGNKVHAETDVGGGQSRLRFQRFYNSLYRQDVGLGNGWSSTWHRRIEPGALSVVVRDADARGEVWSYNRAAQVWAGDPDSGVRLEKAGNEFVVTRSDDSVERYHSAGHLLEIVTVDGVETTLGYDDMENPARLLSVTNNAGESLAFTYTADNHVATVSDQAGNTWHYTYDADRNLAYVYRPDGSDDGHENNPYRRYHYNEVVLIEDAVDLPAHLTGISDSQAGGEARYASYEYFADGRVRSSYHAGNAGRVDVTYDDNNHTRTLSNGNGAQTTYTIETVLGVAAVAAIDGPGCATCVPGNSAYSRDPDSGDLTSKTVHGVTTAYGGHDLNGNPGYRIEAAGSALARRTAYTYDPRFAGRIASITEPSVLEGHSKITHYTYDDYGNRTSATISGFRPDGQAVARHTTWEYNGPRHQLSRIDGPRGDVADVTRLRYYPDDPREGNDRGRLREVENANGVLVRSAIRYTATGKVASEVRPNGLALDYSYYPGSDRLASVAERTDSGTRQTRWTYLDTAEVDRIVVAADVGPITSITFGYDAARRLVRVSDGQDNSIRYTLDSEGNRVSEQTFDSSGTLARTVTNLFDSYGRLVNMRTGGDPLDPLEQVDREFSMQGDLLLVRDGNGSITGFEYDALKHLLAVTRDVGGNDPATADTPVRYGYDVADRLQTVVDPNNGATNYRYDDLGNLLERSSPDTGITSYAYDAAGNLLTRTTASGTTEASTERYTYDALNRLRYVATPAAAMDIEYAWDDCDNGVGRLCGVTTAAATVAYDYDAFGHVRTHQAVRYVTDPGGRVRSITYPSGATVSYQHDAAGRVRTADLAVNGVIHGLAAEIRYLPFGGIGALEYANGRILTQDWDGAYRLLSQTIPGVFAMSYTGYDRNGNLVRREAGAGGADSIGYDALDRAISASGAFGTDWRYAYDPNGNRVLGDEGAPVTLAYAPGTNRLARIGSEDVVLGVTGNLLARGNWSYRYDSQQRLALAARDATPVAYFRYNGLGQRVSKTGPDGAGKLFLYGIDGELLAEADQAGTVLVEYIYLDGSLLAIYLPDSDNDGVTNRDEVAAGTSPVAPDDDGDGLDNREELLRYGTLIGDPDSDADGVNDGDEVALGSNPLDRDSISGPGDIDADGQVAIGDLLALLRLVRGERAPAAIELAAGDLNRNDRLDAGDLVMLSRKLLGLTWQSLGESALGRALASVRDRLVGAAEAAAAQGRLYFVHNDHLGAPRVMTDAAGGVVWRATYDPFGSAVLEPSKVELNVRFPGQYYDQETGLHYNYYRYYDPSTGRYITSDPIGLEGGINTYLYAKANPVRFVDPTGLVCTGVPDNPFGFNFAPCCQGHDDCYGGCGKNRKECDKKFYECLLKQCESEPGGPGIARRSVCRNWARNYYWGVRGGGWFFYKGS
ncbi:MAG: phospholipase A2 [Pseudomonadota bacterium]